MADLAEYLRRKIADLPVQADDRQLNQLMDYMKLMMKWNRAYNLTAVTEPTDIITRHLLDSLSIAQFIDGEHWLDVGTGAGLPGIPLAIIFPEKQVTLLDSNGKKTRFLFQVCMGIGLNNTHVVQARAEQFQSDRPFDRIFSRAVANASKLITCSEHLLQPNGKFYLMKGAYPKQELSVLPKGYKVLSVRPLSVPDLTEERHLLEIASAL